jgi:methylenetetrahydrofolate--tRNA-(uracil-5-)-methyltransferase
MSKVAIIGAGLAGCEAALVLARHGISVSLFEARPHKMTPAHSTDFPAELVCSNSFKSQELPSGHGQLKAELTMLASPLLVAARKNAVPAGSALAVDRDNFSQSVAECISAEPLITFIRQEVIKPPEDHDLCIITAGPLASEGLCNWLTSEFSSVSLNFYDAIAPIIAADSIDRSIAFFASRWKTGEGDYLNCPFSEEEYRTFFDALTEADKVVARNFENEKFFEACLPVEEIASRGYQALTFGPLRPIGIDDPRTGRWPYALCQLRKENLAGESFNMVGFQTRLTIPEQKRIFRMIPGLANAEFLRFGSIHRNTFMDSPRLLAGDLSFKSKPDLFLAGQLCGNEGYTESIATGHLAALFASMRLRGTPLCPPPEVTALGALLNHVTSSPVEPFSPSNVHFGLFPSLDQGNRKRIGKKEKKELLCKRAGSALEEWMKMHLESYCTT